MFLEYLWVAYAYFKRKKDFFSVLMQNKIEFNNSEAQIPVGIYLLKVNNRNFERGIEYVKS